MIEYTDAMVRASSQLQRYSEQRRRLEDNIVMAVEGCRGELLTWAQIGSALGVSPQSAWERYGLTPEQKQQRSVQTNKRFKQLELVDSEPDGSERTERHEPGQSDGEQGQDKQP